MPAITDEELDKYTWHHSIDLGDGVVTQGNKTPEVCTGEADVIFDRLDLTDRSVLDIGAWNGYFSFTACKVSSLGVKRINVLLLLIFLITSHVFQGTQHLWTSSFALQ